MDDQLHCLHCYGHASVSLYSAYALVCKKRIAKNVQVRYRLLRSLQTL